MVFNLSYKLNPSFGTGLILRYYVGLTDTTRDAVYDRVLSIFVSVAIGDDPSDNN